MNDYSDIIQILGAMILVSLLVTNANKTSFLNKKAAIEGEIESEVIAVSQNILEEARALAYDEETADGFVPVNVPADFSPLGPDAGEDANNRAAFDDFDDYDGYTGVISTIHGDFDVSVAVEYIDSNYQPVSTPSSMKRMTVNVINAMLTEGDNVTKREYNFSLIRSYYAD